MAIPIQCPECHKKYQAPDHMAGKRVKCKHCGVVFLIAADARSADAGLDLSALDELNAMTEAGKRDAIKRGAAEDIDSLFQCEYPSEGAPRTNKLYIFPMSRLLDHWLPPVLLAIGLIWMVREAFERNESGRTWVGFFRAALFVLAFFASVFPFTTMGFRAASCKLNYELPPRPGLRAMGVYAVPFALACAMWMILGGMSGLLIGLLIGAVVALPLQFLLFRLLPREAPVTFGYSSGSYLLAIVVAAAAAFSLNLMLVGTLRATKTEHALAASPFGADFQWDGPVEKMKEQIARGEMEPDPPATDEAPATAPTTTVTTSPSTTVGPSTRAVVTAIVPSVPSERDVVRPSDAGKGVAAVNRPAEGRSNDRPPQTVIVKPEGIVAEVKVIVAGGFKHVIHPAIPAPRAALVRDGRPGHDHLELWDTDGPKKLGEFDVPRAADGNGYTLSPDGEFLCFVTDFPRLAMQVWSFGAGRFLRQIDLEAGDGEPRTVGFCAPDQLVLQRNRNGQTSLQVWNLKAARPRPMSFAVPAFDIDPNRYAFSPDGSTITFIVQGAGGADLESYTLATGRPIKQMPIVEVNWNNNVTVAGLAYTPDSQRIAAVFADNQGAGFFVAWPATGRGGKALVQQFLPIGVNLPAEHAGFGGTTFQGRAFHWLDQGHAWLLYGNSVFDADTGAMLGSLNQHGVRSQSATPDGDTCHIVRREEFGGLQLAALNLDLAGARKRVVGGARPATRQ